MKKYNFTRKCTVIAAIFKDSVSGVIPVAIVKIKKMAESRFPRFQVNEVCLLIFYNNNCIIK